MLSQEWRQISLKLLLFIYHDITGGIFHQRISRQTGMKSPSK